MQQSSGVALVTTVWLAPTTRHINILNAFLLYHVSIGVERITVVFDGDAIEQPTSASLHVDVQSLVAQGRIELLYRWTTETHEFQGISTADGTTQWRYADCIHYDKLRHTIVSDVASRQLLHAAIVMNRWIKHNREYGNAIRWLLHLDIDELLYCEGMQSISPPSRVLSGLITTLDRSHIDQLTIVNYEGVPMTRNSGNYFLSTTRFRRHTARIPLSSASHAAIREWQQKSPFDQFFLFYDNGKSLVRIPKDTMIVPASVHHWRPTRGHDWHSVTNFYDPRRSDTVVWQEPTTDERCSVLHYPVCGLEWLVDKYERLGTFPDVWGGTLGSTPMTIPPCFHLQARDACQQGIEELTRLYKTQVWVDSSNESFWQRQLHAGVCEEITFVRKLLLSKKFTEDVLLTTPHDRIRESTDTTMPSQPPVDGLTVQKAWMLAAISEQYL